MLGIPCESDRVAQMAVKLMLDETLEALFHRTPSAIEPTNRHIKR